MTRTYSHLLSLNKPPCCFTLLTFLGQISENIFFFLNLLMQKIFFDKNHWFQLSTKYDWIISLLLISIKLNRVRSHQRRNELKPVWGFILVKNPTSVFSQPSTCVHMNRVEMKLKTVFILPLGHSMMWCLLSVGKKITFDFWWKLYCYSFFGFVFWLIETTTARFDSLKPLQNVLTKRILLTKRSTPVFDRSPTVPFVVWHSREWKIWRQKTYRECRKPILLP